MDQLFVSYFGDGRYWDNTIRIPAYPSGYSYERPFRYGDKWIQSELLSEMSNEKFRREITNKEAILCMRFLSEGFKWKLLPIRKITITDIDYLPDNHSVYFSLGPFYNFDAFEDLSQACVEIAGDERQKIGNSFFFRSLNVISNDKFVDTGRGDEMWVRFSDLIAKDDTLPIHESAKQGLFFRFRTPSRDRCAQVGKIHQSWQRGDIFGSLLYEGKSYELVLFHRVPFMIGTHDSFKSIPIKYEVPSANIELNRKQEDFSGNYQTHVISLFASKPTGTWADFSIVPGSEQATTDNGQLLYTIKLSIPLLVKISRLYRFQKTYIWLFLLWGSLFISTVVDNVLEGRTNLFLMIISGIAALFSAIAVFYLKGKEFSNGITTFNRGNGIKR